MPALLGQIKDSIRLARRVVREQFGRDLRVRHWVRCPKLHLGSGYGGWSIRPDLLTPDSIVYSFGIGRDISFDLAMIDRFGVIIHAFDPTPRCIEWLRTQKLPKQFVFHEYGLAEFDGVARFTIPSGDPGLSSYSMVGPNGAGPEVVEAQVRRLTTLMTMLGHTRLDVLKMDIEGAEFAVIDDLAASNPPLSVEQLLVEFHYLPGDRPQIARAAAALEALGTIGLRPFARSPVGLEISLTRVR